MKASHYLWIWLGAEALFFLLFSRLLGWGLTFLLVAAGSYFGWRFLRQALSNLGRQAFHLQANRNGFAVVGGFLLFLPGLFNSLLALCFVLPALQNSLAPRLWVWLNPQRIYEHYSQVHAQSNGQNLEAELLRPKKKASRKK